MMQQQRLQLVHQNGPLEMSLVEAGRTGLCINPSLAEEMVPTMEHLQEELGCKHQQPALQGAGQ